MSKPSTSIDYWRNYFESANGDIFDVIQQAIMVAVTDCPREFRIRRDEIAERLFTCGLPQFSGCRGGVELVVHKDEDVKDNSDDGRDAGCSEDVGEKESKGTSSTNVHSEAIDPKVGNISYNEAEALTDILEEENQMIEEVFRIKEILENSVDQSSSVLFESLRRLELMDVTMQTLMTTNIGNAVSALRKHPKKDISKLARTLVKLWKTLISEWLAATEAAKGNNDSPDSVKPSVMDEEEFGLPSPPLDDGIFFAPETNSMELSKFFDGIDDDGNLKGGGRNDDQNRRKPIKNDNIHKRKPQFPREQNNLSKDNRNHLMVKEEEAVIKQTVPSNTDSGFRKPSKVGLEQKADTEVRFQHKVDTTRTQRKPLSAQPDTSKPASGLVLDQKLENAKRKLHQGYQQAENAKKQRTIQVMELQDLPKQSLGSNGENSQMRRGSHNRQWSNGRR